MHQKAVAVWEDEKKTAKAAKKVFKKLKPKQESLESPIPRPKVTDLPDGSDEEDEEKIAMMSMIKFRFIGRSPFRSEHVFCWRVNAQIASPLELYSWGGIELIE